jgi:molybdopterin synthase catalytic subunit
MSHYSDAEDDLERARQADSGEHEAYLLKMAHVHAMLAVADAIVHVGVALRRRSEL